jgi:nitrogen fixation/metabolism regulation signal transduction histidine kinase
VIDNAGVFMPAERSEPRLSHDRRIVLLALAAGLPGVSLGLFLLWTGDSSTVTRVMLSALVVGSLLLLTRALRTRVVTPLNTLSNLLAAIREEDFSIRARPAARTDDPLGDVMSEVNTLAETLRAQRLGALEATALLRSVMAEIDVAVFTFDGDQRLRLVNRAGERVLARPSERLLGQTALDVGLTDCLAGDVPRILDATFPGGAGKWEVRRTTFRQDGLPHQLLVLSDLSRPLRDEERQAWQRLIRVIGHELNNSLAPIKSVAASLESLLGRPELPGDWRDDTRRGLGVIAARAESLGRFTGAYARLARLPRPALGPVDVKPLIERVVALDSRAPIALTPGPGISIVADIDQLEQLLINLVRNAVDAALETGGGVRVGWGSRGDSLEIWIEDEGPGLSNTTNLFVPFFTTKPAGSGIGLVLSRQIAEGHGGSLTLDNRSDRSGCRALLTLPMNARP